MKYFPMSEISYFNTTGTAVTISGQSDGSTNMVKCTTATALTAGGLEFDNGGANNGRMRYIGIGTKSFHVAITFSGSPATNNDSFVFGAAVNGTVVAASKVLQKFGLTTDTQAISLHAFLTLAQNQYVELYVGNLTAARNVTLKSLNIFALGMV